MAHLPQLLRTDCSVPRKKFHSSKFGVIYGVFLFYIENGIVCVLIRIASMRRFKWEHTKYLHDKDNQNDTPSMPPDLALRLTLTSLNYPCLEHIFIVPKMFEPLKFYCNLFQYTIAAGKNEYLYSRPLFVSDAMWGGGYVSEFGGFLDRGYSSTCFPAISTKGSNFCDLLFTSQDEKAFPKWISFEIEKNMRLGVQMFSLKRWRPFRREAI